MNRGAYSLRKEKPPLTREGELREFTMEAIAYMEQLPSTALNVRCRRQLREVAKYLGEIVSRQ